MTTLADALTKAVISTPEASFAVACHDLAVIALNRSRGNPTTAVQGFLNEAAGRTFRSGPLLDYLTAVAAERPAAAAPSPAGKDREPDVRKDQTPLVSPGGNPTTEWPAAAGSATVEGTSPDRTSDVRSTQPVNPIAERKAVRDVLALGHSTLASARRPAGREPDAVQRAAMAASAKATARTLLDTFIISDGRGSKIAIGDIRLGRLEHLLEPLGKAAWTTSREYGLVWLLLNDRDGYYIKTYGKDARVRDVIDDDMFKEYVSKAIEFSRSPSVILPRELEVYNA